MEKKSKQQKPQGQPAGTDCVGGLSLFVPFYLL